MRIVIIGGNVSIVTVMIDFLDILVVITTGGNPSTSINPTIAAAIIGALLGAIGTLLAQSILGWHRRKIQRKRLRIALAAELFDLGNALRASANNSSEIDIKELAYISSLPSSIYESNGANLGSLTKKEISGVIRFYTSLSTARQIALKQLTHDEEFDLIIEPADLLERHQEAYDKITHHLDESEVESVEE